MFDKQAQELIERLDKEVRRRGCDSNLLDAANEIERLCIKLEEVELKYTASEDEVKRFRIIVQKAVKILGGVFYGPSPLEKAIPSLLALQRLKHPTCHIAHTFGYDPECPLKDEKEVTPDIPDPQPMESAFGLLKTHCSICSQSQFNTPSGITCRNGHGGAPSKDEKEITPDASALDQMDRALKDQLTKDEIVGHCSICNEPQFDTPSGHTCKNGHGGVESKEEQ